MEPMHSRYPGSPWEDLPDPPEMCVICKGTLPENSDGEVVGYEMDGSTCSKSCHEKWIQDMEEHRKSEQEADAAFAEYCAEMARTMEEGK